MSCPGRHLSNTYPIDKDFSASVKKITSSIHKAFMCAYIPSFLVIHFTFTFVPYDLDLQTKLMLERSFLKSHVRVGRTLWKHQNTFLYSVAIINQYHILQVPSFLSSVTSYYKFTVCCDFKTEASVSKPQGEKTNKQTKKLCASKVNWKN